jgi:single-stranded DNA-binding protein
MSLRVLVAGKLVSDPQVRTAKNGKPFATAILRVSVEARAEGDPDNLLCNVIAFEADAVARLTTLGKGDSVAVSGPARVTRWRSKDDAEHTGLAVTAEAALSPYGVRKRASPHKDDGAPFNDEIPI